jgi:hypothetical protein
MADRAENRSSPSTMVFVQHLGGAVRRFSSPETAFSVRDCPFVVNFMGDWRNPDETPRHVEWVRKAWNQMLPHSTGVVYLNYAGREEENAEPILRGVFRAHYDRLVEIKTKYDPTNFFRLNQNIKPHQSK